MRFIIEIIRFIVINAVSGAVLTALVSLGNLTAHWVGLVGKPTWAHVIGCFVVITSILIILSVIEVVRSMYHYKTDAGFRHALDYHLVGTWKDYKRVLRDINEKEGRE